MISALVTTGVFAQESKSSPPPENRQVFFGEQHLHTEISMDAFTMGARNTVDDAYNYAKGLPVKKIGHGYAKSSEVVVQKKTPYDWAAVTDHTYMLGMMRLTLKSGAAVYNTEMTMAMSCGSCL